MAPIIRETQQRRTSGQHDKIIAPLFTVFGLILDIQLRIIKDYLSLEELTMCFQENLVKAVATVKPDCVFVQGAKYQDYWIIPTLAGRCPCLHLFTGRCSCQENCRYNHSNKR